jgi:hypothetical protein
LPERAIDAFQDGLFRRDFKEELGRCKPKTIDHLMSLAKKWAAKTPSQHPEAVVDQWSVTSTQKTSSIPVPKRKAIGTISMKTATTIVTYRDEGSEQLLWQ